MDVLLRPKFCIQLPISDSNTMQAFSRAWENFNPQSNAAVTLGIVVQEEQTVCAIVGKKCHFVRSRRPPSWLCCSCSPDRFALAQHKRTTTQRLWKAKVESPTSSPVPLATTPWDFPRPQRKALAHPILARRPFENSPTLRSASKSLTAASTCLRSRAH